MNEQATPPTDAEQLQTLRVANALLRARLKEQEAVAQVLRAQMIIGAETPIAAFSLATTWRAEKAGYMDEVAELTEELKHCAMAHQKALEQNEHYGEALTQLAMTGNQIANDALGTAPYNDRTRTAYREIARLKEEVATLQAVAAAAQRYNERPYGVENGALRIGLDRAVQAYGEWLRQARVSSNGVDQATAQTEETRGVVARPGRVFSGFDAAAAFLLGTCPRCGNKLDNPSPGISVITGGVSVCTPCLNPGETELLRAR